MAVYGYCRVSTDQQAREGVSLVEQQRRIIGRATEQGWTIGEMLIEEGVSGSIALAKRPQGARLLALAAPGDAIIACKLDRMFRNTQDALHSIKLLKRRGVKLYLLDLGGEVTSDNVCYMLFTIVAAVAEFERARISERVNEAFAELRRKGKWLGGAPFGWRIENGELHEVPAEQAIIKEICRLIAEGHRRKDLGRRFGMSVKQIGTIWLRANHPELLRAHNERRRARERAGPALPAATSRGIPTNFGSAATAYARARGWPLEGPSARTAQLNIRRLRRLIETLGDQPLETFPEEDLRALANRLYPSNPPATKNREVIGPAHSVLHYAAAQGWIAKRTGTLLT
jgi:putative DNA-invertase from lambdoid prophage Rac